MGFVIPKSSVGSGICCILNCSRQWNLLYSQLQWAVEFVVPSIAVGNVICCTLNFSRQWNLLYPKLQ